MSLPTSACLGLLVLIASAAHGWDVGDVAAVESRMQDAYEKIRPAIVQIEYETIVQLAPNLWLGGNHLTGVILTPEGHVVARGMDRPTRVRNGKIAITLPGGNRVAATALGWSDAWGIEVFKITTEGPWPHIDFDESIVVRAGQRCILAGFPDRDAEFDGQPSIRPGFINQTAFPHWVTSSVETRAAVGGVFDLEGRLLGVTTAHTRDGIATHTGVQILRENWDELIAGGNIDRGRLESAAVKTTRNSPTDPSTKDSDKQKAIEIAKSATVRIKVAGKKAGSGVILSSDGHVISHAHGGVRLPGQLVEIGLSDGRKVDGKVLVSNAIFDVSLIKITPKGIWPHADMGDSTKMQSGDECIFAGYPHDYNGEEPLIREPQLAMKKGHAWSSFMYCTNCETRSGDSGGGVFDLTGRLIGNHCGVGGWPELNFGPRIELARANWNMLSDDSLVKVDPKSIRVSKSDPARIASTLDHLIDGVASAVVNVRVDGKQAVLGTIVGSDGLILTKASELSGKISCQLADGRVLPATIKRQLREYDVATLKIEASDLPTIRWNASVPLVGSFCSAVGPGGLLYTGVVSLAERPSPPKGGFVGVLVEDHDGGVRVSDDESAAWSGSLLRTNDIIRKVDGRLVSDSESLRSLIAPKTGSQIAIPGDFINVEIERADKTQTLRFRLFPKNPVYSQFPRSPRRTGFPSVFDISEPLERGQCGGPVVDRTGAVVGIAIAAKGYGGTYVLPTKWARKITLP